MSDRFSRDAFEKADPTLRLEFCRQLAESLGHRLATTVDFHGTCYDLIGELRREGHDLWSMDESDDFQDWGPNYQEGVNRGLYLRFVAGEPVTVTWFD